MARRRRNKGRYRKAEESNKESTSYTLDELLFLQEPPQLIEIDCPICMQVMLNESLLTTCCGHHFCGPCIRKIREQNGACPFCKSHSYQVFPDKERLRIIGGLRVFCTNDDNGCQWVGDLKDLPSHINEGNREGGCQYEIVKCRYYCQFGNKVYCSEQDQRRVLDSHEKECPNRPYTCQYCSYQGRFHEVTQGNHFKTCPKRLVNCPNSCTEDTVFERDALQSHLKNDCPLQPVTCELEFFTHCDKTPLRKDYHKHLTKCNAQFSLISASKLAKQNKELTSELEDIKKENQSLKKLCHDTRRELGQLRRKCVDMKERLDLLEDSD